MKTLTLITLTAALVALTGCASISENLAKDNATVKSDLNTVYGKHNLIRANPQLGHDLTISPDGTITIKTSEHWRPGGSNSPAPATIKNEAAREELRKLLGQ